MRNVFNFISIFVVFIFISAGQQIFAQELKAIKCGSFIDVKNEKVLSDIIIIIQKDKILKVGTNLPIPANSEIIDLGQYTVLPGLIDAHTHLMLQGDSTSEAYDEQLLKQSIPYRTIRAVAAAKMALEYGFTSLRDVGNEGTMYADVDLKQAINRGIIPGPRLQISTRAISITGAYPLLHYAWELSVPKGVQIVDGVDECRQAVREQISSGSDWIKIYCDRGYWVDEDGGISSKVNFTREELNALVDEAHRWKVKVAAHAIGRDGIRAALEAGVNSIEHGDGFDNILIAQAVKQGVYWCPTMLVSEYVAGPRTAAGNPFWSQMLEHLYTAFQKGIQAGVKIATGSDAGGYPWTMNPAGEIALMVKHGMSPWQALRASTMVPAELMGWQEKVGSLEPGKLADLVAVKGNPLQDITLLQKIGFVMKEGQVYKNTFTH
jgi:imidazolonepropionase-like amidohydrolase